MWREGGGKERERGRGKEEGGREREGERERERERVARKEIFALISAHSLTSNSVILLKGCTLTSYVWPRYFLGAAYGHPSCHCHKQ